MTPLYLSENFRIVNKAVRTHFDEVLPEAERAAWKAVHRLDFETSGCLLLARPGAAFDAARSLFGAEAAGRIRKLYLAGASKALNAGLLQGLISGFVGSRYRGSKKTRWAFERTAFRGWHSVQPASQRLSRPDGAGLEALSGAAAERFGEHIYVVELISGARHQIRTFFEAMGAPLRGDPVYGDAKGGEAEAGHGNAPADTASMALHAWKLEFENPLKEGEWIRAEAPLT